MHSAFIPRKIVRATPNEAARLSSGLVAEDLGALPLLINGLEYRAVDTGGLLQADWCTGVDIKLSILASLVKLPGKITCVNGKPTICSPGNGQPIFSCNPQPPPPPVRNHKP